MKIAIIGSRDLKVDLDQYLSADLVTEVITGGAHGVDYCAIQWAKKHSIPLIVLRPDYEAYGRSAPLIRDKTIIDRCNAVYAFWDGNSRGTAFSLNYASLQHKKINVVLFGR